MIEADKERNTVLEEPSGILLLSTVHFCALKTALIPGSELTRLNTHPLGNGMLTFDLHFLTEYR